MSKAEKLNTRKLIVLVLVVAMVVVLVRLGFWQLDRAKQKEALIQQWHMPATSVTLPVSGSLQNIYQKITIKGKLNKDNYFLLDNKIRNGKVGYELLALFTTQNRSLLAVNLGWVKGDIDRSVLPAIELLTTEIVLTGWLKKVETAFQLKADVWVNQWPKRIQQIDFSKITSLINSESLGNSIEPFVLLSEKPILPELTTQWKPVNMSVEKHLGYAFQWFLMAFVLCFMLIWFWRTNTKEVSKDLYEQ